MTEPASPRSISSAAWGAVLAVALAIPTAVLVLSVIGARLDEAGRRVDAGLARVASAWLAERAALVPAEERDGFLAEAGRRMGALAGLHDRERGFDAGSSLATLAPADVERVLSQDLGDQLIGGVPHQMAAASLRAPLSRLSVVLAVPAGGGALPRGATQSRLGALAVVFLLAAAVFGACFGRDFGRGLDGLGRRLARTGGGATRAREAAATVVSELTEIDRAVERLEQRLGTLPGSEPRTAGEPDAAGAGGDDLLSSVARDLHAPLQAIVGLTGGLLEGRDGELSPSQREDILIIRQASERLLMLVQDLLDLTGLLETGIELDLEPVVLADVAEEVLRVARGELKRKQLDLELEVEDGSPVRVRGDRQRLWQVLTNLVSNGIKFTERGSVTVRVARDAEALGMVRLEVEDTGAGIPSLEQASVFDTFRQLGGRARGQRGAGLGLAICRRLVELHGGTIRVSSRPGQGARFTVLLPEEP